MRFSQLNLDDKHNSNPNSISGKLRSGDNEWARNIEVRINTDNNSRKVVIPACVQQMDDLSELTTQD